MSEEKKIIIDEDWKTQIASEREALEKEAEQGGPSQEGDGLGGESTDAPSPDQGMLPPASMEMLITTLAAEAMMSLGQMPVPGSASPEVNLPQAKYVIDLLEVLQEKTRGNLSDQEDEAMQGILYQLRMAYVAVQ